MSLPDRIRRLAAAAERRKKKKNAPLREARSPGSTTAPSCTEGSSPLSSAAAKHIVPYIKAGDDIAPCNPEGSPLLCCSKKHSTRCKAGGDIERSIRFSVVERSEKAAVQSTEGKDGRAKGATLSAFFFQADVCTQRSAAAGGSRRMQIFWCTDFWMIDFMYFCALYFFCLPWSTGSVFLAYYRFSRVLIKAG